MKAIEAFPISEEEAMDLDELKETFPNIPDLRSALEDYFHIYDDAAQMSVQDFDRYFADFIQGDEESNESIHNSRKTIKNSVNMSDNKITASSLQELIDALSFLGYNYIRKDGNFIILEEDGNEFEAEYTKYTDGTYELMLYNISSPLPSSRKTIKSARSPSAFRIENVTVKSNWIYDTFKGGISVVAVINGVNIYFPFNAARWGNPIESGIDCNDAVIDYELSWDGTPSGSTGKRITISNDGGQTHYALKIGSNVLTSAPKQNQKDYSFTGQYYSTRPVVSAFKKALKELYEANQLTPEFLEVIGVKKEAPLTNAVSSYELNLKETISFIKKGLKNWNGPAGSELRANYGDKESCKKMLKSYENQLRDLQKKSLTNSLDQTEAQTFKETLIRAGYTEEEAEQILEQAEQQEQNQESLSGEVPLTSGNSWMNDWENEKDEREESQGAGKSLTEIQKEEKNKRILKSIEDANKKGMLFNPDDKDMFGNSRKPLKSSLSNQGLADLINEYDAPDKAVYDPHNDVVVWGDVNIYVDKNRIITDGKGWSDVSSIEDFKNELNDNFSIVNSRKSDKPASSVIGARVYY